MPFSTPLSLRALVLIGSGLLAFCGIAAVAALVLTTSYLHRASDTISEVVSSIVAAEELQKNLLEYSRSRMALALGDRQTTSEAVDESEQAIRHWYSRIEMHASIIDEKQLVSEVQRNIEAYINTRSQEKAILDPSGVFFHGKQFLDPARTGIRDLVMLNQQQAKDAQASIDAQDRMSDRLGAVISATLGLLTLALFYGVRQQVYKPLMALRSTIRTFAGGDLEARAVPEGPVELRQITGAFNDLVDGLKRSRENHFRFLAAVAHDLRNPLSALRMSFELVSTPGLEDPAQRVDIQAIAKRQIDQLDQMIGDLLDRSRIEAGKFSLSLERRDLRIDVEQAAALHRRVSLAHSITVKVPDSHVCSEYDSLRMSQVLNNLVGNAIKYSPSGGNVAISLEDDGKDAVIEVRDEGLGVAPEDLARIFEPFRRSRATRDTIPGVGLGLAVARRLVEAHGGLLEVESKEGVGSVFRVRLPHPAPSPHTGSIVACTSQTANDLVSRGE